MSVPTSIRIPPDVDARLRALVQRSGRSRAHYIILALNQQLEDIEDAEAAVDAYREYLSAGGKTIPLDDVLRDDLDI